MLVAIALYFALKPNLSDIDRHQRMTPFMFGLTFVPMIHAFMITIGISAPFVGAQINLFTTLVFSRIESGF